MRKWVVVGLASLAMTIGAGSLAEAASAAYTWSNTGRTHVRAQPSTYSAIYATVGNGTPLAVYCWVDSQWAYGNYWTNRWFMTNVPTWRYGGAGFVHASLVAQQPAVPHC